MELLLVLIGCFSQCADRREASPDQTSQVRNPQADVEAALPARNVDFGEILRALVDDDLKAFVD